MSKTGKGLPRSLVNAELRYSRCNHNGNRRG
uniref:Capsid and scaffold protein n=1 Tax=Salmonella phage vB_SE130_2P TaxID=3236707 RepID=A0AB39C443_9VIRU